MTQENLYLLWFANENVDFRFPEVQSIIHLFDISLKWIKGPNEEPFWIAEISEEDIVKLASRSVTLRSVIKLWGSGKTAKEMHDSIKNYPKNLMNHYLKSDLSFRVDVVTFGKTFTMKEKVDKIETFNYLPAEGPINLKNPDVNFNYIEYYGLDPVNAPEEPHYYYFGVWFCDGQRSLISKYSIKKRKFIGNTTMDPQLAFIMANQALVQKGDLVMDPFVGTGSLLVAAAHFGGYVIGVDIDFLMLHGKTRPSRIQERWNSRAKDESVYSNMLQYGTQSQYIDVIVGDSSLPFWHEKLKLDSIITDPPYGIRESTERIGTTKDYKISADHLATHIPSKTSYCLSQIFMDLITFAVNRLKLKGRLVTWIPLSRKEYNPSNLPQHPCLKLISNSEQPLSGHASRRLLTWEKISEPENVNCLPKVPEIFSSRFRENFFHHGETRKQKRERLAKLRENEMKYRKAGECSER